VYSEKVIIANMEEFARREGWMPEVHSIDEVQEFIHFVEQITKAESNSRSTAISFNREITKNTADNIRRFVQNEQALCSLDAGYWESRYGWGCDEKGEIFKFKNRDSQKIFDHIIAEFDEKSVAIELLILKARQQGITTKVALRFLHRLLFLPNSQAVMASVETTKSELIARILDICLDRQPWWLIPNKTTDRILKMGFDNGSVLSIQSGSQATGIAQGWTPTLVHVSEIGDIPNPKKTLEEGLFKATHSSRRLFAVYEGTGNGNTGWLADKWRSIKEDWPKGRARLCPVFIPWPMAPDLYPEADWLRKFPIPGSWQPNSDTRKHVRKCEVFVRNTPYLAKICGKDWKMPRHQQWFWEFNYMEACKSHTQKVWMSQMPADDLEALVGKNDLVFDPEVIEVVSQNRNRECQAYAITGNSIDDGFEPDDSEIDYSKERIRVKWTSHRGQTYEWVMIPLLPYNDDEERSSLDKVLIWEEPQEGYDYTMGIDTADGLGKDDEDRSVLSLTHSVQGENSDNQVAELCSNRINGPQMVGFAACLAAWYGEKTLDPRGVKFCIEQRERPGDDCQLQLKLMGFNFHHVMTRYDSKTVKENKGHKEGWFTGAWSRPMLMNRFVAAVRNGWYKPHSKWLVQELADLERKFTGTGKTRLEHQTGKHDDRVLGAALSYFSRHALDVMADRELKKYALPVAKNPDLVMEYSNHSQLSVGEM
jgi:hypothetical protein